MWYKVMNTDIRAGLFTFTGCALVLAFLCGCERAGPNKVIVEGNVSYLGQPVSNGEIRFRPIDGTAGPVSGAPIKDGHYEVVGKGGVPVGTHRVEIQGFRQSAGPATTSILGEGGGREQYIPPRYSGPRSVLKVTVDSTSRRLEKDFDLQ